MGVVDRLEDAQLLAAAGRWEGALTMVLLAVAGASREQFPKGTASLKDPRLSMGDREAFIAYLRDNSMKVEGSKVSSGFMRCEIRGKQYLLDEALYELYRCYLVHEGSLAPSVALSFQPQRPGMVSLSVTTDATGRFTVSTGVLDFLANIVAHDLARKSAGSAKP